MNIEDNRKIINSDNRYCYNEFSIQDKNENYRRRENWFHRWAYYKNKPCSITIRFILAAIIFLFLFEICVFLVDLKTRKSFFRPKLSPKIHYFQHEKLTTLSSGDDWEHHLPIRRPLPKNETLYLIELNSNLPAIYWQEWTDHSKNWIETFNSTTVNSCKQINMIPIHQFKQSNRFWQMLQIPPILNQTDGFTLYIYNAYFDDRFGQPQLKILTTCNQQEVVEKLSLGCLLWFHGFKYPIVGNLSEIYSTWPEYWSFAIKPGIYGPQLITCDIPAEFKGQIPCAVSLTSKVGCENVQLENMVRVIHNLPEKKTNNSRKIGVCAHAFRYRTYDFSVRLVEWLEMVKLMGAEKVYFYVYDATEAVYKVLKHYQQEGFIEYRQLTFPGYQPNTDGMYEFYYEQLGGSFWPQEMLEMNDCLYKNLYRYDYIALFDVDEMIMPQKNLTNWIQVIDSVESQMSKSDLQSKAFYVNHHSYVYEMYEEYEMLSENLKRIPSYLFMMRHTYRAKPFLDGTNVKCFHRTRYVSALHTHFPMRCVNQTMGHHLCSGIDLDNQNQSMLMHYRPNRQPDQNCMKNKTLEEILNNCTIHDRTAWKWYRQLAPRVQRKLLKILGK